MSNLYIIVISEGEYPNKEDKILIDKVVKFKMDKKTQLILKKLAVILYEQFIKDLNNGNIKNEICSINKQSVGKSAKKAKTFQQTALSFK